jgi:hypothetical protein
LDAIDRWRGTRSDGPGLPSCRRLAKKGTSSEAFRPLLDRRRQAVVTSGYDLGSEHGNAVAGTPIVIFKLKLGPRLERAPKRQIDARAPQDWYPSLSCGGETNAERWQPSGRQQPCYQGVQYNGRSLIREGIAAESICEHARRMRNQSLGADDAKIDPVES